MKRNIDNRLINRQCHYRLSNMESKVLALANTGMNNELIAKELFYSPRTVEKMLYNVYQKTPIPKGYNRRVYALKYWTKNT